jgi:hypothetical protein
MTFKRSGTVRAISIARHQKGMSMTEYLVATLFVVTAFLVPWGTTGKTVVQLVLDAIKKEESGYLFATGMTPPPGT